MYHKFENYTKNTYIYKMVHNLVQCNDAQYGAYIICIICVLYSWIIPEHNLWHLRTRGESNYVYIAIQRVQHLDSGRILCRTELVIEPFEPLDGVFIELEFIEMEYVVQWKTI